MTLSVVASRPPPLMSDDGTAGALASIEGGVCDSVSTLRGDRRPLSDRFGAMRLPDSADDVMSSASCDVGISIFGCGSSLMTSVCTTGATLGDVMTSSGDGASSNDVMLPERGLRLRGAALERLAQSFRGMP